MIQILLLKEISICISRFAVVTSCTQLWSLLGTIPLLASYIGVVTDWYWSLPLVLFPPLYPLLSLSDIHRFLTCSHCLLVQILLGTDLGVLRLTFLSNEHPTVPYPPGSDPASVHLVRTWLLALIVPVSHQIVLPVSGIPSGCTYMGVWGWLFLDTCFFLNMLPLCFSLTFI